MSLFPYHPCMAYLSIVHDLPIFWRPKSREIDQCVMDALRLSDVLYPKKLPSTCQLPSNPSNTSRNSTSGQPAMQGGRLCKAVLCIWFLRGKMANGTYIDWGNGVGCWTNISESHLYPIILESRMFTYVSNHKIVLEICKSDSVIYTHKHTRIYIYIQIDAQTISLYLYTAFTSVICTLAQHGPLSSFCEF